MSNSENTTNQQIANDTEIDNQDIEKELDDILNEMTESDSDLNEKQILTNQDDSETTKQYITDSDELDYHQDQPIDIDEEYDNLEEDGWSDDSEIDESSINESDNTPPQPQNIITDDRSQENLTDYDIINKNTVVGLTNDFHTQMYSVRHLPLKYLLVLFVAVPLLYIGFLSALIYIVQHPKILNNLTSALIYSLILAIPFCSSIVIRHILLNINKELIIKNHAIRHDMEFATINDARVHWIKQRIGDDKSFFAFAERLAKWKDYKHHYKKTHEKSWVLYIYDPQYKVRSLLLLLFFVVTFIVVAVTAFYAELETTLVNLSLFDNMSFEWLAVAMITGILCFFAFILPMWRMIVKFSVDMFDSLIEDDISEIKFNILINFLLDNSDFVDDKSRLS